MKGFVGIGRADHVETAITEATAGLKKADFLILIAPFSKIEAAGCDKSLSISALNQIANALNVDIINFFKEGNK